VSKRNPEDDERRRESRERGRRVREQLKETIERVEARRLERQKLYSSDAR
jgi:hypothetical protein